MPIIEGWGTGPWGPMPWGGVVLPDPIVPGWGPGLGDRYEILRRRQEYREQHEIHNVLFRVQGLRAEGEIGQVSIIAGAGRAVQLRRGYSSRGALGRVEVYAEAWTPITPALSHGRSGAIEILNECCPQLERPRTGIGLIGKVESILTQRNLTDEEFIHMISEML